MRARPYHLFTKELLKLTYLPSVQVDLADIGYLVYGLFLVFLIPKTF